MKVITMHKNIIFLLVFFAFSSVTTVFAQPRIAEQPCDAGFWRQMEARAWLEAEREIMQNQNLIFRPDSVLSYTCFDQFAKIAAAQGGEIFVHTNYFGEKIIQRGANEGTDKAIEGVVTLPLKGYRVYNFNHTFLGGRSSALQSASTAHSFQNPTGATNERYTCQHMSAVWQAAKCANFIDNDEFKLTDGFYPFETIKGLNNKDVVGYSAQRGKGPGIDETRQFPSACGGARGVLSSRAVTWSSGVEMSENRDQDLYVFQTPLGQIFKEVNDKIEPGKCDTPAIRTGVQVITKDGPQNMDGVCTNPGCTHTQGGVCDGTAGGG
jgi:hypothetical protein